VLKGVTGLGRRWRAIDASGFARFASSCARRLCPRHALLGDAAAEGDAEATRTMDARAVAECEARSLFRLGGAGRRVLPE
jgi:hypothetical protein